MISMRAPESGGSLLFAQRKGHKVSILDYQGGMKRG